ncbi:hypothetical protein GCM10023091_14050 [Ravibacter arvi]|uniref:EamA domain-containing protein n=1 Tax=Ravibacter arvi TaxID=2051041 RepID=A0ABP8LTC2_9BACT
MKKSYLVLHTAVVLAGFTGVFGKLISLNEALLVWYLEPVYAILIAFLFFGESKEVNASFYAGLGLVMFSVLLQSYLTVKARRQEWSDG